MAPVLKTGEALKLPWVRIPPLPLNSERFLNVVVNSGTVAQFEKAVRPHFLIVKPLRVRVSPSPFKY